MNLIVQAANALDEVLLPELAALCCADSIERLAPNAVRLHRTRISEAFVDRCNEAALDWTEVPAGLRLRDFGLFVTDMDSTLIDIECIDEIADMQGLKAEVAAITESAMRGEIDFRESLTRRVALLAGLPETALARVYEERLRLNPGAEALMAGLREAGIYTVLVSGGFTYFTDRLRERLGFDEAHANQLEIIDGKLTGRVIGPVVDGEAKCAHLLRLRNQLGLLPAQTLAAGDGANDLAMIQAAGFGIAYHAKPVLRAAARCRLDHVGLDGILRLFE